MAVPNLRHIVEQVRSSRPWPFRSKEQLCAYTNACVVALHNADPNFGHLVKTAAQNHCVDSLNRRHATDVALYRPTGQIVDFITSAGFEPDPNKPEPPNSISWNVGPEGEYPTSSWFAPADSGTTPPPPPPPPNGDLEAKVAALQAEVNTLKAVVENNRVRMEAINTRFDEEMKRVYHHGELPEYSGRAPLFGGTVISRPRT